MQFSQLKKNGFQMQFSQLKKKKWVPNAIFSAEKEKNGFQMQFSQLKKGFQMQFSQRKKRFSNAIFSAEKKREKKSFQMQFSQLNTEAGQIKYLGEATLGGQCHVPYMQVRMILNYMLCFIIYSLIYQMLVD